MLVVRDVGKERNTRERGWSTRGGYAQVSFSRGRGAARVRWELGSLSCMVAREDAPVMLRVVLPERR